MTEEEFHVAIYDTIVKYNDDPNTCFSKLMKLKYPGSKDSYIKLEHARFFFEKYSKIVKELEGGNKIDKDFTKKAYEKNSKIFKDAYLTEFKPPPK